MRYESNTFVDMTLDLEGNEFVQCTFKRCTLVYSGGDHIHLDGCKFVNCKWGFKGAAARTVDFLSRFYQHPAFRPLVEGTLEKIRRGATKGLLVN